MNKYDISTSYPSQMDVCWVIAAPLAPGGTAYIVSEVITLHVPFLSTMLISSHKIGVIISQHILV